MIYKLHKIVLDKEELQGERLDKVLCHLFPEFSRNRIKSLILTGKVKIHQKVIKDPNHRVLLGEEFWVEEELPIDPLPQGEKIPLDIVYEDAALIVLNKPVGMVVHPGAGNKEGTLVNALISHCEGELSGIGGVKRPGIVHRLDKDTSGLMVVAKTDFAHQKLSAQFADRVLSRTYLAFITGHINPLAGTIHKQIGRSQNNRQKMAIRREGGKDAITHYKTLECYGEEMIVASLLECKLETGRTHQIRVHLSAAGHSLIGDPVYGSSHRNNAVLKRLCTEYGGGAWQNNRQALHATTLSFLHPLTDERLAFEVPLPPDLSDLQNILKKA